MASPKDKSAPVRAAAPAAAVEVVKEKPGVPRALGSPNRIAVISFVILMLELSLIRFIPSEIKAISYFTNLLLFSAFFGLGLGCILWKFELPKYIFPTGLFLVFMFVMACRGITVYADPNSLVHYWLQAADQRYKPFFQDVPLYKLAFAAFAVSAIPFVTLGWQLSREMQGHPRLRAYAYDLLGSFIGTVSFAILSYEGMPPWVLIIALAVVWAVVFHTDINIRALYILPALGFFCFMLEPHTWLWSPYYFLQYDVGMHPDPANPGQGQVYDITVWVNSSFHQEALNFEYSLPDLKDTAQHMAQKFALPYQVYAKYHNGQTPKKILILGAGSGNDVNIARIVGVQDITAVEIDPGIASIGIENNPMHPYQDPRVHLIIDDGRHFLWNAEPNTYDMVLFGTLDSQTLLSGQANLRLDNYIYTTQSFQDVRRILKDDGMLATNYSVFKPWFLARIYNTAESAFPGNTQIFNMGDNYLFNTIIMASKPTLTGFVTDKTVSDGFKQPQIVDDSNKQNPQTAVIEPTTDDWPYIYISYRTISDVYQEVLGLLAVVLVGVFITLRRVEKSPSLHLDFFFLGVGFSLMESAAVVRLALAFGTTWVVSAVVFASVLLTVFGANYLLEIRPNLGRGYSWFALIGGVLLNYFFPVADLLHFDVPMRVFMAFLLIGTPVFFAGITFSRLFRQEADVGYVFGINMVGAMTGGAVEYLSMLYGMRMIWIVLGIVYFMAYVCNRTKTRVPGAQTARA